MNRYLFYIIPVLFIGVVQIIRSWCGPFLIRRVDPDYVYLFNSLAIANLDTPFHIDHPGTPLQSLGAIAIHIAYRIQKLTHSTDAHLTESVIQNPEFYLNAIHFSTSIVVAVCLVIVGQVAFNLSKSRSISLFLQLIPFLPLPIQYVTLRVMPEVLLIGLTQMIIVCCLLYLYQHKARLSRWFAPCLGIIFGIGMAIKVTFLPMIVFFLLIPTLRQKAIAITTSILTFIISTLPVLSQYPRIFSWLSGIATHTGIYGRGTAGFVDPSRLDESIAKFISLDPTSFCIILESSVAFIWISRVLYLNKRKSSGPKGFFEKNSFLRRAYILYSIVLGVSLTQFLITLKHHGSAHYSIPATSLSLLLIFTQFLIVQELRLFDFLTQRSRISKLLKLASGTVMVLISLGATLSIINANAAIAKDVKRIDQLIDSQYKNCTQINYYGATTRANAFVFSSGFVLPQYSSLLLKSISDPNIIFFGLRGLPYRSTSQFVKVQDFFNQNECVVLRGTSMKSLHEFPVLIPEGEVQPIYEGNYESLYRAISLKEPAT